MSYSRNILSLINLETVLLKHDRILLHSSFIRWQNQGILFTAPSGTGKSTQAKLWEEYEHAEVLNGDRAALEKTKGSWTAWGLPYAGTSGIYRNESAPISAIVVLRQSKENHMRRLLPREALRYIYPELTNHRWDPWFADRVWNLMSELICEVPIYLLECRPDREAVQLVKKTILKGE